MIFRAQRFSRARLWSNWNEDPQSVQEITEKEGRPQQLNQEDITNLKNYIIEHPNSSRKDLTHNTEANPKGLSGKSLQNYLNEEGFLQKIQKKVIEISQDNKKLRVKWAKSLLRNKRKILQACVYSDETQIEFQNSSQTYTWTHEDLLDIQETKINRWPQKVLIWGSISKNGPEHIAIVEGSINQDKYINILEEFFNDTEIDFTDVYYQHDNAKAHKGKKVTEFLEKNNINVLELASQSPDANPIERVWSLLKSKVSKNIEKLDNYEQLKTFIKETFMNDNDLKQMAIKSIKNIPDILYQIIEKEGDIICIFGICDQLILNPYQTQNKPIQENSQLFIEQLYGVRIKNYLTYQVTHRYVQCFFPWEYFTFKSLLNQNFRRPEKVKLSLSLKSLFIRNHFHENLTIRLTFNYQPLSEEEKTPLNDGSQTPPGFYCERIYSFFTI
ncbi:hypothetical protein ABPG72_017091 [Tetrahymena utriculariae]